MGVFPPPTAPFLTGRHCRDKHEDQPLRATSPLLDLGHGTSLHFRSNTHKMQLLEPASQERSEGEVRRLWSWLSCRVLVFPVTSLDLHEVTGASDKQSEHSTRSYHDPSKARRTRVTQDSAAVTVIPRV